MIPTTIAGIVAVILGVLPGIPADKVYRYVVGVSWRESQLNHVLRLFAFSVFGLALYAWLAGTTVLPDPLYVLPSTFAASGGLEATELPGLGAAYVGHVVAATLAGFAVAGAMRGLTRISAIAPHRDSWDHFVNALIPEHWVLVTLSNGETYAGKIDQADVAVEPEYRDLVLIEPAILEPEGYRSLYQQHLFLPGSFIASIATVTDPEADTRLSEAGSLLFRTEDGDE